MLPSRVRQSTESLITSTHVSIAEQGREDIDKAIFCWALKTLKSDVDLDKGQHYFSELAACYNDKARYYHSLGHPRTLLPTITQQYYVDLLLQKNQNLAQSLTFLDEKNWHLSDKDRFQQAQEILAAFYHDIVHQIGKRPQSLDEFLIKSEDVYKIDRKYFPLTSALLRTDSTKRLEDLSCMVVEHDLNALGISAGLIIPILLAIYATIPFGPHHSPIVLQERLLDLLEPYGLEFSEEEFERALNVALSISRRDLGSFCDDNLDEFNQKTWAIMFERNAQLANPRHNLQDELEAISSVYNFDKMLLQKISRGELTFYHSFQKHDNHIKKLNENALTTLRQDAILQGLQVGSLMLLLHLMQHLPNLNDLPLNSVLKLPEVKDFLQTQKKHYFSFDNRQREIIEVLKRHGGVRNVNGVMIHRGSSNGEFAVECVKRFGIEKMLAIADYINLEYFNVNDLLKSNVNKLPPTFMREIFPAKENDLTKQTPAYNNRL